MHKILIVENDLLLAQVVEDIASQFDAKIFRAVSLEGAYAILDKHRVDLVLLDRLLDDGDGIEIAEYLQDVSYFTRIIIFSTLGELEGRLSGLNSGADLYLPKPLNRQILKLYIEKALCTQKVKQDENTSVGAVTLAPETGLLSTPSFSCRLRKKECEILNLLMMRKNQVLSRDKIIESIWGSSLNFPTHSTIDAYIRKIRVILREYSGIIKTNRGFGYSVSDKI